MSNVCETIGGFTYYDPTCYMCGVEFDKDGKNVEIIRIKDKTYAVCDNCARAITYFIEKS